MIVIEDAALLLYVPSMESQISEEPSLKDRMTTIAVIAGFVVLLLLAYAVYGWAFYHIGKWVFRII